MSLLLSNRSSAPAFLGAYRSGKEGVQREEGANPVHWLGLTGMMGSFQPKIGSGAPEFPL